MSELILPPARRVLPIASLVTFLGFLDTHLLIPVMALYAAELGASVGIIGLVIGLYSLTNTPANILFGRLIDRVGYKLPLMVGLIGDALSMFFYSLCRLPVHLALVRVFHGTGGGLIGPATMSITAGYSDRAGRGRAMGYYGMALAAATLVGYGLGGIIASRLGYKVLFLFGSVLLTVGAGLSLGLPKDRKQGGRAVASPSGTTCQQLKSLLKRKGLALAYCSIFAQYFTFGGVVTLLPIYIDSLGMEAFHVGMLLATFAIMFTLVQFPSGALSDRVGRLRPTIAGLGLGVVALVVLPSLASFLLLAMAMALYGVAYGLIFPSISALVMEHTLPGERGLATGVFHALLTSGVAVGAPVVGWVGGLISIETGLVLNAGVMVLALLVALSLARRI